MATRYNITVSDELGRAIEEAAQKGGVTPLDLVRDALSERFGGDIVGSPGFHVVKPKIPTTGFLIEVKGRRLFYKGKYRPHRDVFDLDKQGTPIELPDQTENLFREMQSDGTYYLDVGGTFTASKLSAGEYLLVKVGDGVGNTPNTSTLECLAGRTKNKGVCYLVTAQFLSTFFEV